MSRIDKALLVVALICASVASFAMAYGAARLAALMVLR